MLIMKKGIISPTVIRIIKNKIDIKGTNINSKIISKRNAFICIKNILNGK